ncbi:MAG TPA: HWE histidine kinase domain-containing protein [Caulobacteraceae bacterium]|jgi:two-component sensor histidine kinase|nr:HWE histidine kinase domain-containing protein [Caulobacteraceae bacterium]
MSTRSAPLDAQPFIDAADLPMAIFDAVAPGAPLLAANAAFLDELQLSSAPGIGASAQSLLGIPLPGPDLSEQGQIGGAGRELIIEVTFPRGAGTHTARLALSPLRDASGAPTRHLAILRERTADAALAREAEHRGMNALALVQSVVRLSRGDVTAVRERVESLVRAHMLLADHGWRRAPLQDIVRDELDGLAQGCCDASGEPLMVRGRCVQPLALALRELRLNAITHGALSSPQGKVRVSWRAQGEDLNIEWRETGGPAPAEIRRAGFGTTITRALIERQLRGEVHQSFTSEGFHGSFRLPQALIREAE